jgi:four helix bundle protein
MSENDEIFKFEKLVVYQKSLDYIDFVYETSGKFPSNEIFMLTSQYVRAAQSISLNIAEGACGTNAMFKRYLNISKGSIRECIVCTTVAFRRNYITDTIQKSSRIQLTELSKMISGLIKSLK